MRGHDRATMGSPNIRHRKSIDMVETMEFTPVEFTPVYDDAIARSLESEFARLEGKGRVCETQFY